MNHLSNQTLHTLNASAREQADLLARLLRCASSGDGILLIENGVYNLTDSNTLQAISDAGLTLYCLQADLLARGLKQYEHGVRAVDDNEFVALSCSHQKVISWFV
jgi:tRNA 2-thiouridine synthesizing protein B